MLTTVRLPSKGKGEPTTAAYTIEKHHRYWRVCDPKGRLICLTVYKCGAKEVVRRLSR